MIDETRIEPALRQGPPFRTGYVQQPLPLGSATDPRGTRLLALVALTVVLVAALSGAALVGSGDIKVPVVPILPEPAMTPGQNAGPAWIATGNMVTPRSDGHTVTLLADGTVLVAGGADGDSQLLAGAEVLDPATLTWTSTGAMNQARAGGSATLLPDGRVLVAGGGAVNGGGFTLASAELYDPATGSWTATGDMTQSRQGHTATLLPDGKVLVAGGSNGRSLDSAEQYDPATESWTATGDMTQGRAAHKATLLPGGRVLVAGGVFGDDAGPCCMPLSSAELFDPRTGSWTATASMIELRGGSNAVLLLDGRVLVAGEINGGSVTTAEIYDPGTGSWSRTAELIDPSLGAMVALRDGRVLAVGGSDFPESFTGAAAADFTGLTTAQLYDPSTGTWTRSWNMLAARTGGHQAVTLADGQVLVIGGRSEETYDPGQTPRWSGVLSDPAAEVFDPNGGS